MTKKERARAIAARAAQKTKSLQRTGGEYAGAVAARKFGIQERSLGPVPLGVAVGLAGAWLEYKKGASAKPLMQAAIGAMKVQGPIALYLRASMGEGIMSSLGMGN